MLSKIQIFHLTHRDITTCAHSAHFKNPLQTVFSSKTYREGLRHLGISSQNPRRSGLTLTHRVKQFVYGLALLIPVVNALALCILQKLYPVAQKGDGPKKKSLPVYHLFNQLLTNITGVKTAYLLPAAIALVFSIHSLRARKYNLALVSAMHSVSLGIYAIMNRFTPSEAKLIRKVM